jgi:hypothetical protein
MATQIKPDGTKTEVKPANGKHFSLEELYKLTECDCIDIVGLYDGSQMIVDDNGLCVNEPVINREATVLYQMGRHTDSPIAGTVLVCSKKEVR